MSKNTAHSNLNLENFEANWIEKLIHSNSTIIVLIIGILIFPIILIGNYIIDTWQDILLIDKSSGKDSQILSEFSDSLNDSPNTPDTPDTSEIPSISVPTGNNNSNITPDELDILVDTNNLLPVNYEPSDLVYLRDYGVKTNSANLKLRKDAAIALLKLLEANKKATDQELSIISGYRSYREQDSTFDNWINRLGIEEAQRVSAPPGASEHQLGTTVDIVFSDSSEISSIYTSEGPSASWKWLDLNAHKYGFVMSYRGGQENLTGYKFEPWHWRYVGIELATKIRYSADPPQDSYKSMDNIF